MKITDLIPKATFEALKPIGQGLAVLYDELEAREFEQSDEIIEGFVHAVAAELHNSPAIEFALVNLLNDRYAPDIEPDQFIGHALHHYKETRKRQKRTFKPLPAALSKADVGDKVAALHAYIGVPLQLDVNLATIQGQGDYNFVRGTVLCSEDELHFPIGIKPYVDKWWFLHDPITGYLIRQAIPDWVEAREILANTMSVEDSTTLEGVAVWLSIMGDTTAPDSLGRLLHTIRSTYAEPDIGAEHYVLNMPLWVAMTKGTQKNIPRFQVSGRKRLQQRVLDKVRYTPPVVEPTTLKYKFEDGMSQRKKLDLRRSMLNRIMLQGIQDTLAIRPLEDALQARLPMWLLMADKKEITQAKADSVVNVSVAADIGTEIAALKSIVQEQMRIALDNNATQKQRSGAMARAQQTARTLMQLRKDAGYFDLNDATKAGIFQNKDSTVLQDDGAQFDKLVEQLAQAGGNDEQS